MTSHAPNPPPRASTLDRRQFVRTRPLKMETCAPSSIIRPRLTEYHDIFFNQESLDFAIPFLDEDVPLYLDPFLLWKSPSQQDQSLHTALVNSFNHLGYLAKVGRNDAARGQLITASECAEVGLGVSKTRVGKRISDAKAAEILASFSVLPDSDRRGYKHFEEIQLYVDGISKDRISDIACSFIKSFLIDFTIDACDRVGIPRRACIVKTLYDYRSNDFKENIALELPVNPLNGTPLLLVPKRWLRFVPWIDFDDYFRQYCPQDDIAHEGDALDRVQVLRFNRENYGVVQQYIVEKERTSADCINDPLFRQIPVLSAKRKSSEMQRLPTGTEGGADRKYEEIAGRLLPSLLYPHLDFAQEQSRTDSGVSIRDLIFYNNREHPFLKELFDDYGARQIVMEMKNVDEIRGEHVDQLNRYLAPSFSRFGVLVTRHELKRARRKQTIDLWSGQRKAIVTLTDSDLAQMVELFESRQRKPLDVLIKKYVEFRRLCPV